MLNEVRLNGDWERWLDFFAEGIEEIATQPIATSASLVKATRLTAATVNKSLAHLERIRVVKEITNRQRWRVFSYRRYVNELGVEL